MTRFIARPGLLIRQVEGETVILDRNKDRIHTLNPTASFIWNALSAHPSADGIVRALSEAYDIDPQIAAKDVNAALQEFNRLELIAPAIEEKHQ